MEAVTVDLPQSNIRGRGKFGTTVDSNWNVRVDSASIEGADILAWYRAFDPDVAEGVAVEQFFAGKGVSGWPLRLEEGQVSSQGGILRVPGLSATRIGSMRGAVRGNSFVVEPVRLHFEQSTEWACNSGASKQPVAKPRELQNWAELRFVHDASLKRGSISAEGHLDQAETFFKAAAAFGKTLNHGWELSGGASGSVGWSWEQKIFRNGHWNGTINLSKAEVQAAGLNLPIDLEDAGWNGKRDNETQPWARWMHLERRGQERLPKLCCGEPAKLSCPDGNFVYMGSSGRDELRPLGWTAVASKLAAAITAIVVLGIQLEWEAERTAAADFLRKEN